MADLVSRPYKPNPQRCCERCTFSTGEHADFCEKFQGLNVEAVKATSAKTMQAILLGASAFFGRAPRS